MADSAPAQRPVAVAEGPAPTPSPTPGKARTRRGRLFAILFVVLLVAALGYGTYWFLFARNSVSTDNAYVDADAAQVTPLVSGAVIRVAAGDTDPVKQGQVLVEIDPTDAKVALAQAEAQYGQAQRKVRGYFATDKALAGQVAARDADITRADAMIRSAQADLQRARTEFDRRQKLAASGAVSGDELTQTQNQLSTAQAALDSARAARVQAIANKAAAQGTRETNTVLISGSPVDENPEVAAARARVEQARLDLDRTVIRAPYDGVVAKKSVSLGQRVQPGAPLMQVVKVGSAYVNANFKEVQLRCVKIGQPVTLVSDLYGGKVRFHGKVAGLAGGTGAAFALIPAQNATGNWIKVVQRLPVRVNLDPRELGQHPLRVGLSMKADIDVSGC